VFIESPPEAVDYFPASAMITFLNAARSDLGISLSIGAAEIVA